MQSTGVSEQHQADLPPVICVVGPTASGKSDLAQNIALAINGEVVSADSMQIYKGMDIGTGKLLPHERKVPHFGLDLVNPGDPYSAALFQQYARDCFKDIQSRGKKGSSYAAVPDCMFELPLTPTIFPKVNR